MSKASGPVGPTHNAGKAAASLPPELAGEITRKLLEYHATNRLRLLVNTLQEMGVTAENFHVWNTLQAAIPSALVVDVQNMLLSLQKGIDIAPHALVQVSPSRINAEVKRTIEQHRAQFGSLPTSQAVCEADSPASRS